MKNVFREEYDKILTDNTLNDIDKISGKEQLNNAKTKLNELLQTIQNEKDIICTENEVKEYETKITDLVKSYEDRVTAIEKEEQEKKAKEEAERQAAQQNSQNQSSSGNSSYSSGGSNGNSGSSGGGSSSNNGRYFEGDEGIDIAPDVNDPSKWYDRNGNEVDNEWSFI